MDFSFLTEFFGHLYDFIQYIWNWMYVGVYEFIKEILVVLTKAAIYTYFRMMIFAAEIGFEVVQDIFSDLGVTQEVQSAYTSIPEDMRNTLAFFRIPEALTLLFSAIPTRWAMKFIPFIGR